MIVGVGARARAYAGWARSGADVSFEPTLAALTELLPPPPGRVLDVGCGEGRVGGVLAGRGYAVVGVDADSAMVALAVERHPALAADAADLPFPAGEFDTAISVHVLMEVELLEPALVEIARVLVPGGVLVAVIEHPFASGRKVACYSRAERYAWDVTHDGVDVELGGIHRPLDEYVRAVEGAGLGIETMREISAGGGDPMSLALRAVRR
jgi:SAM-dependent methyltransferase